MVAVALRATGVSHALPAAPSHGARRLPNRSVTILWAPRIRPIFGTIDETRAHGILPDVFRLPSIIVRIPYAMIEEIFLP